MFKKNLSLILLLVTPLLIFAQAKFSPDFKVTKSTPYEVIDANSKVYMGMDNGFAYSVKVRGEKVSLQKFDVKNMKEAGRSEYEDFPKYAKFISLLKSGTHLYYIFEAFNKKADNFTVYYREVNQADGKFLEIKPLFTTKGDVSASNYGSGGIWGMGLAGGSKFEVSYSHDESKILIQYRNKPESKNDAKNYDVLGFYVFDSNFNKLWGKEEKMPHTEKQMNNLAYTVGSDGTVYMLSFLNETKSFEVITITSSQGLKNKELPVKKGLHFDSFSLLETANGNIVAAGYYDNGTEMKIDFSGTMRGSRNVNGLYVFELTKTGALVRDNDYPFSIELIKKYLSLRQKDKADDREADGKAGINDLFMRDLYLDKNGNVVIVGEIYYIRNEWQGPQQLPTVHYSDMVVTKIDSKGKLLWQDKIPKNQIYVSKNSMMGFGGSRGDLGSLGITTVHGKDAHYVLFVDNKKNATLKYDQPSEAHRGGFGGFLMAYKIDDATGKIEKHSICDLTDVGGVKLYQFDIDRVFDAQEKVFLLEGYIKDKQDMMVKMELQK